jgi:hypothetical protein
VRVEAARVRENPGEGVGREWVLPADRRIRLVEAATIGPDAENGDGARPEANGLVHQRARAAGQLLGGELVGARRRARAKVRDSDAQCQQGGVFLRRVEAGGEAGGVKGLPEAVPGPAEMVADGGGVEAGIDTAEQDAQAGRDHVGEAAAARPDQGRDVRARGHLAVILPSAAGRLPR